VDAIEKYEIDMVKLTTCQSVQLHNLEAEDLCELIEPAWRAGMISRGGGGDFPRNVMASPLSGVQADEYFDVLPYAEAMGEYLMQFIKAVKFPRKLKVGFSNSPKNETHATFRDLGFVANEDRTFDVYAAGGLGNRPALGVRVAEHIAPEQVCYYAKAMVDTFVAHGNYENRGRARTRFMQETLGVEGFVKAYRKNLQKALENESLAVTVESSRIQKAATKDVLRHRRAIPQKQAGLYAVFYQPVGGVIAPQKLVQLYEAIRDMQDVEIRLTPEEGLYLINCSSVEAQKLLAMTEDGANTLFETSVACIGSSICQVGVRDSQEVLRACVEAVRREDFADGVLPQIHISGCPSSCSAHQIGTIGFRGAVKQSPEGPKPACAIFIDGCAQQGSESIAEAGPSILVEDIPRFLVELGRGVAAENSTYAQWAKAHPEKLAQLIQKYA
jgi:ferredoxin-nitrite reductase